LFSPGSKKHIYQQVAWCQRNSFFIRVYRRSFASNNWKNPAGTA